MTDNIYEMKLHDTITINNIEHGVGHYIIILRVAGGWLYNFQNPTQGTGVQSFIPYHNEFQMDFEID